MKKTCKKSVAVLAAASVCSSMLLNFPSGTFPIHWSASAEEPASNVEGIAINEENFLDVLEIDAASNRGIDEIRDLREKVAFAPVNGRYKVYIIDEVHMLSSGAFNALLKTLEEPPSYVIFILATTEKHKIPVTILSLIHISEPTRH